MNLTNEILSSLCNYLQSQINLGIFYPCIPDGTLKHLFNLYIDSWESIIELKIDVNPPPFRNIT